jgi:EpsI family protein
MNLRKKICLVLMLTAVGATAMFLDHLHAHQRLGLPGIKTSPIPDSKRLVVELPEQVLNYQSKAIETDAGLLSGLPHDTSFGQRVYWAPDNFAVGVSIVLMGGDRSSIHKPQFCLRGSGWEIVRTEERAVRMARPMAYDLPVTKLSLVEEKPGVHHGLHQIYVYWFVADNEYTSSHWQRMWWLARDVIRTGVLQRWAYITVCANCRPGDEDATYERLTKFIAAAAPEFQLTPKAPAAVLAARP